MKLNQMMLILPPNDLPTQFQDHAALKEIVPSREQVIDLHQLIFTYTLDQQVHYHIRSTDNVVHEEHRRVYANGLSRLRKHMGTLNQCLQDEIGKYPYLEYDTMALIEHGSKEVIDAHIKKLLMYQVSSKAIHYFIVATRLNGLIDEYQDKLRGIPLHHMGEEMKIAYAHIQSMQEYIKKLERYIGADDNQDLVSLAQIHYPHR